MKLTISELNFALPDNPFGNFPQKMDVLSEQISAVGDSAGTGSEKFRQARKLVYTAIKTHRDLVAVLDEPVKVRALAVLLQESDIKGEIQLAEGLLQKIDHLRPFPSALLVQSIYQHFLTFFDRLTSGEAVANWLKRSMKLRNMLKDYHEHLLSINGPKWLAERCFHLKRDFNTILQDFDLQKYAAGEFLKTAKRIYFIEQLKRIPVNKPHELLQEVQNISTFDSRYDEHYLVGHKVLQILINRAPQSGIDESWLNTILAIAGDPRIPESHPKYRKWWSRLEKSLKNKAEGWLSRLDLRLFLEALENYSFQPGKSDLARMYPARKSFLEGLLDNKMVLRTRLYLSSGAIRYLKRNYRAEHLPNYSGISDGDRSIIHVELRGAHLIEGSHNCYLWIYKRLDSSAIVFNYSMQEVTYRELTNGLNEQMEKKRILNIARITHSPTNFSWQRKAIESLRSIGVALSPQMVLSPSDYQEYIRIHGRS